MTPLAPLPADPRASFAQRAAFMGSPDDYYLHIFGGRMPTMAEKLQWIETQVQRMASLRSFANDTYVVVVERQEPFFRLSIQRHDREPCREWKHLQQMKNEMFGSGHEAVELFPAEDRLIDTSNEYHLWVHTDPTYRFPIGFNAGRCVVRQPASSPNSQAGIMAPAGTDTFAGVR